MHSLPHNNVESIFLPCIQRGSSQLFLIHMCLLQLQTPSVWHPTHRLAHRWYIWHKEMFPVLSAQYFWRVDMCLLPREVDICWFHHFPIPPGRISDLFGRGREGRSLFSWEGNKREGDKKFDWYHFQDFHQSAREGCYNPHYSVHKLLFTFTWLDPERYGWKVFGNFMLIKDSKKARRDGGRRGRRGGHEMFHRPTDYHAQLWSRGISC